MKKTKIDKTKFFFKKNNLNIKRVLCYQKYQYGLIKNQIIQNTKLYDEKVQNIIRFFTIICN